VRFSTFALKGAGGGAALRSESWDYSLRSDVLSHTVDSVATAYAYDDEGQLLSESRAGYATSYTYDGNGNRKTRVVNGATETYTYDVGDKLESISYSGGGSRSFTYDLAGRMLTDTLNSRAFFWTADSRLASLTATTGNETYAYSPFGTRAKVGTRTFLRAGAGVTAGVLDDGNAKYTPGVSEVRSGTTTYSHSGLKHMGAQTGSGGTVAATNTYDAFGGVQGSTGSWQGPFGTAGAFGYQSPQNGNEQGGLHLLGHRYYDATLGRILTRDPIGDGSNWYASCASSPVNTVDPSGLRWVYEQDDGGLYYDPPIRFVVPNMPFPPPIYIGDGFSGRKGKWRDNPDYEHLIDHGPIPRGKYRTRNPREFKSDGVTPLPFNIPLTPDPGNDMRGRTDFLLHDGREELDPSWGCVILSRPLRERIWGSEDRRFDVVRDKAEVARIRRRFW